MVLDLLLSSLYFFLPAYIANMVPVLIQKINVLNTPVSEKRFGKNKTWRGVVGATLAGGIVFWLQKTAYQLGFQSWAIIDYADFSLLLGFLLGFGAIAGDLIESYYKRKAGIEPGKPWPVFDQLDFVFGALVCSWFIFVPSAGVVLTVVIASPVLHIITNHVGYWLGIRNVKF